MTANEMCSGLREERFQISYNASLHAADIRSNCATFQCWKHSFDQRLHLGDGRAKDDEIGVAHGLLQVASRYVHGAEPLTFPHAGCAADKANHRSRDAAPFEGHS